MLLMEDMGTFLAWSPKTGFDGEGLGGVVFLGARAVGVDVVDVGGCQSGVFEGFVDGDDGAAAFGVLVGDGKGVAGGAVADDFGKDFVFAPRARAWSSDSRMTMPAPSPRTNPPRVASKGRQALGDFR